MHFFMQFVVIFSCHFALAGSWQKLDNTTLRFDGSIQPGDFENFLSIFDDKVGKIIINSVGGDGETGLSIGEVLLKHSVDIEVQGICGSSCANYIFTAGKRKYIQGGVVGFHGNVNAIINVLTIDGFIQSLKDKGILQNIIDEAVDKIQNNLAPREAKFFNEIGIPQEFFDRTQLEDKGMGNGQKYFALFPTAETFLKYGFKDIFGIQDVIILENDPQITKYKDMGKPYLLD